MKKLIIILSFSVMLIDACNKKHTCADSTHAQCDGVCECDGVECPRRHLHQYDYIIEVVDDSFELYDTDHNFIGTCTSKTIDSLIDNDNL